MTDDPRVYYAKFNNKTLKMIGVGSCRRSWICEQETALDEVAVEVITDERPYMPDDLYVDPETFVVRRHSDGERVSVG